MIIKRLVVASAFLSVSPAFAQDSGVFMTASIGRVSAKTDVPAGVSANDSDTSWSLGGGYRINQHLGIEGGYRDFGKRTTQAGGTLNNIMLHTTTSGTNIPLSFGTVTYGGKSMADITAWTLGGFVAYPLADRVEITARAGMHRWRSKWSSSWGSAWTDGVTVGSEMNQASGTNTGTEPYVGTGMAWRFDKASSVGMNWTRFKSASGQTNDSDVIDISISFGF